MRILAAFRPLTTGASIMNKDKAITATSLRMPDGLLRQLTKAAHKCEVSRTEYINQALLEAVNKTLGVSNESKNN
jgi:metal-responsive CopG/Arc/MetJ family transcriptional regulator